VAPVTLSRRTALGLMAATFAAPAQSMPTGSLIPVRDTKLYVEISGPSTAAPLLYMHGGPGGSCYDFSELQAARLSSDLRLVMYDQRSVLRSDPISEDQSCTLDDLIEDAEALRATLGISRWSVLGHSFGGHYALVYASRHPDSIDKVLFENPTFDFRSTASYTLAAAAREFQRLGQVERALAAFEGSANQPADDQAMLRQFETIFALGPNRNNLYVHGPEKDFMEKISAASGIPREVRAKVTAHQRKLFSDGAILRPRFEELANLTKPALLLQGAHDIATAPVQVARYLDGPDRKRTLFANSSHFCRFEEPELYASEVSVFVNA
jgi:proline iminopeptidase